MYSHLLNHISKFPKVHAKYTHDKEKNINPAYCDIDNFVPLCDHEKIIWVLRSDLILAVGIKNALIPSVFNSNILHSFDPHLRSFIDLDDRYGHPSLAIKDKYYDGTVHYAGWLSQQKNHLEIFLHTGRYQNDELTAFQRQHLERYIAIKFMQAYGEQPVIFIDWIHNSGTSARFFKGESLASQNEKRIYSPLNLEIKNRLLHLQVEEKFNSVQLSQIYNNDGEALLHQAVIEGHIELILYLIAEGVDLNVVTSTTHTLHPNMTALDIAFRCTQYYAAMLLVDAGAQINEPVKGSDHLIHIAVKNGLFDLVQSLISKNPNLMFAIGLDDQRPIELAGPEMTVFFTHLYKINKYKKQLRKEGSMPYGLTSLHIAVHLEYTDIISYLIEKTQVDINAVAINMTSDDFHKLDELDCAALPVDSFIGTALDIAVTMGNDEAVEQLIHAGATVLPNTVNLGIRNGDTIVYKLMSSALPELHKLAEENDLNLVQMAAVRGDANAIRFLIAIEYNLDLKVSVEHSNDLYHNLSARDMAMNAGHNDIVSLLDEAGARTRTNEYECDNSKACYR